MVTIESKTCIGCGKCVADCVSMSLALQQGKATYRGDCLHCGHCVAVCPTNAVHIPHYDMADVQPLSQSGRVSIEALLETVKGRRSIRHYTDRKIEREKLHNLIQAGRYTATAVNAQACRFILVQDRLEELKPLVWDGIQSALATDVQEAQPLRRLYDLRADKGIDYLFRDAPAVLYVAAENLWDAGLAAQNIELAAVAQGLGALYNGFLVRSSRLSGDVAAFLKTEGKPISVCMLLGYPDVQYLRTAPRKQADAIWL